MKNPTGSSGQGGSSSQKKEPDPSIFCTAFKKNRFYIFTKREPEDTEDKLAQNSRDIFVEKPTKEENQIIKAQTTSTLSTEVI
jgi:hypothetical protein